MTDGNGTGRAPESRETAAGAPKPGAADLPRRDGEIPVDIRNAIRTRTERVALRSLEKRGFRSVQVLDMATIERIVAEAVDTCLRRRHETLGASERTKLEAEAKEEFLKLLAEHKRVVAEKTGVEKRKSELERQVAVLREELGKQEAALRAEREKRIAETTFSLSPESFQELEGKIRNLFKKLVSGERRLSLAEAGPSALRGLNQLERELAALIDRIVAEEREKLLGKERKVHGERIDLLERRIEKLNKALSETEDALRRVCEAKAIDPGIASIYETFQQLSPLDPYYARKRELLHEIFLQNLVLQKVEIRPEDRLLPPVPASPPQAITPAPLPPALDFAPPVEPATAETAF